MCVCPLPCNNPGLIIVLPLAAATPSGCGSGASAAGVSSAAGSVSRTTGLTNYSQTDLQVTSCLLSCAGLAECWPLFQIGTADGSVRSP